MTSLYTRFVEQGTLTEPKGVPDPRRSLPSMVNWMRALAMCVDAAAIDAEQAFAFYQDKSRGGASLSEQHENSILEHLLFGLHQLSALESFAQVAHQADVARVASVAWYYGIYGPASAMVTAQDGTLVENHTKTATMWDQHFSSRSRAMEPFHMRSSTLVAADAKVEVDAYRRGAPRNLVDEPLNVDDAWDCLCGYLSGTVEWSSWKKREQLKQSKEFQEEGFTDFRKKAAREMRDKRLAGHPVAFVHQAIRCRGKANYREALYLAHGKSVEPTVKRLVPDMCVVLRAFLQMAGGFVFHRLGQELSKGFLDDIERNRAFSLSPRSVWGIESLS